MTVRPFATAGDWNPTGVPGSSDDAFIGNNGVTVTSDSNETVNSIGTGNTATLKITGDSSFTSTQGTGPNGNYGTIDVTDGSTLTVDLGAVTNFGTVELASSGHPTIFSIQGDVQLDGGGNLEMSANVENFIFGMESTSTLTNDNNDISGSGFIALLFFTNDGIVETNNSLGAGVLDIEGNAFGGSFDNEGSVFARLAARLSSARTAKLSPLATAA